jgi:hypothetical protein
MGWWAEFAVWSSRWQVRETLDFAARVQGAGRRPQELRQLQDLEAAAGLLPDPEIDAFMKVIPKPSVGDH